MKLFSQYRGLRRENYVLFFGRIVTNLGSMVWPMLTFILTRKMGLDATGVALLTVGSGVVILPVSLLGGVIADRFNKKNIIIICDVISISFYVVCAFIPLSWTTIALLLTASTCQSMEQPAYNALIADITLTKDRERAYSLQYLGANLGLVAAPTLSGLLFESYLWLAFLISGIAIASSTVLIFFLVRDITPEREVSDKTAYQKEAAGEGVFAVLRRNRVIVLYVLIMALYWTAYSQYGYLMPLDLARVHGDNGAVIYGTVSSLNCIIVVLTTPLITRLFRKLFSPQKVLVGELLVISGYVLFLTLLGTVPIYYVAITLFTFGEIFSTVADGPYISSRIPASHRGRINAFETVLQSFLYGGSMLLVGALYDNVGNVAAWGFVLGVLGAALLLTVALLFADRKKYPGLYMKTDGTADDRPGETGETAPVGEKGETDEKSI